MSDPVHAVVAAVRRGDVQRAAGCCTALLQHRRAAAAAAVRRPRLRRRFRGLGRSEPLACC